MVHFPHTLTSLTILQNFKYCNCAVVTFAWVRHFTVY